METDWWQEAVRQKAEEAEIKFQSNRPVDEHDMVAVALMHPEIYDIQVKLKQTGQERRA